MALQHSSRLLFLTLVLFSLKFIHRLLPAFLLACGDTQLQNEKKKIFHSSCLSHSWTMNFYLKGRYMLCRCKYRLLLLTINFIQTGPFGFCCCRFFPPSCERNGKLPIVCFKSWLRKGQFIFTSMLSYTHSNHAARV